MKKLLIITIPVLFFIAGCADNVSINTYAIKNPNLISESSNYFGSQCIVVAIDAKAVKCDSKFQSSIQTSTKFSQVSLDENSKWEVFTHG